MYGTKSKINYNQYPCYNNGNNNNTNMNNNNNNNDDNRNNTNINNDKSNNSNKEIKNKRYGIPQYMGFRPDQRDLERPARRTQIHHCHVQMQHHPRQRRQQRYVSMDTNDLVTDCVNGKDDVVISSDGIANVKIPQQSLSTSRLCYDEDFGVAMEIDLEDTPSFLRSNGVVVGPMQFVQTGLLLLLVLGLLVFVILHWYKPKESSLSSVVELIEETKYEETKYEETKYEETKYDEKDGSRSAFVRWKGGGGKMTNEDPNLRVPERSSDGDGERVNDWEEMFKTYYRKEKRLKEEKIETETKRFDDGETAGIHVRVFYLNTSILETSYLDLADRETVGGNDERRGTKKWTTLQYDVNDAIFEFENRIVFYDCCCSSQTILLCNSHSDEAIARSGYELTCLLVKTKRLQWKLVLRATDKINDPRCSFNVFSSSLDPYAEGTTIHPIAADESGVERSTYSFSKSKKKNS